MNQDSLFTDDDIDALLSLADVFKSADTENKIYNISVPVSDTYMSLIDKNSRYSKKEKKRLKNMLDVREKNQQKIEKISLLAEDILRGKNILN